MANKMGLKTNTMNNALGYGTDNNRIASGAMRGNSHAARGLGYEDDSRRGYYVTDDSRAEY
jgi:hypothetical protein